MRQGVLQNSQRQTSQKISGLAGLAWPLMPQTNAVKYPLPSKQALAEFLLPFK